VPDNFHLSSLICHFAFKRLPHGASTQPDCSSLRNAAQAKFDEGGLRPLSGGFPLATCQRRISNAGVPTRCRSAHEAVNAYWHSAS